MTDIQPNGLLRAVRILVGDSVFEKATISTNEGWLSIEFEAEDLPTFAVRLQDLGPKSGEGEGLDTVEVLALLARNEQEWLDREYAEGRHVRRPGVDDDPNDGPHRDYGLTDEDYRGQM